MTSFVIIEEGGFGDYIVGVALTEEIAKTRCDQHNRDNPHLDTWVYQEYNLFS